MNRTYDEWVGRDAYDSTGEKIGKIQGIFYDNSSQRPEWVEVKTGLFGGSRLVPIAGSSHTSEGDLQLASTKDTIKDSPDIDAFGSTLSQTQERQMWEYYGYNYNEQKDPYGYGSNYSTSNRSDKDFHYNRWDRQKNQWDTTQRAHAEHTETVPVTAEVNVPIETEVRLRRYQTQKEKMVPVTETEEHVEVADVQAKKH